MDDIEIAYLIVSGQAFSDIDDVVLSEKEDGPEEATIKRFLWDSLSGKAKETIQKIVYQTEEIEGVLTPTSRISSDAKVKILIYLEREVGRQEAIRIIQEIYSFVNSKYFDLGRMVEPEPKSKPETKPKLRSREGLVFTKKRRRIK
jgi:hypothetical protein